VALAPKLLQSNSQPGKANLLETGYKTVYETRAATVRGCEMAGFAVNFLFNV
jgi:hypothetical protein